MTSFHRSSEIEGILFGKLIKVTENRSHTEDIPCVTYEDWEVLKKIDQEYIILIAKTIHIFDGKIA